MDSQPPAWRVFETPASSPGEGSASRPTDPPANPGHALLPFVGPSLPAVAGLVAAVVVGAAAIAIAAGGMGGGTIDGLGPADSGSAVGSSERGEVVIDVGGAVARPGIYHLAAGARVGDAIAAAGGFGPRVDADRVSAEINLAAPLRDGDRILVPSRDGPVAAASPGAAARGSPGLVDLNHASVEELDALPGIGPVTANKIVASRAEAPFKTVDELRTRGLVGQKTFDKLQSLVTI